jgi:hypothetical protein
MDQELFKDEVFRFLSKLTVTENFYGRTLNHQSEFEGVENPRLVAALMVREVPGLMRHVKQEIVFTPIKGMDLKRRVIHESHLDGAYVIQQGRISNKVFLQNFVSDIMRFKGASTIELLQKRFLPQDFLASGKAVAVDTPIIGGRTQVAMAAGLAGGRGYLIKQTAYAGLPIGKVCMFTKDGLDREFFLAQDQSGILKESEFFEPKRQIAGVLRVYGQNKAERQEFKVVPSELGIDTQQFLKHTSFIDSMFEKLPMLRSSIAAGLFR